MKALSLTKHHSISLAIPDHVSGTRPAETTCSQEWPAGRLPEGLQGVINGALDLSVATSQTRLNLQQICLNMFNAVDPG